MKRTGRIHKFCNKGNGRRRAAVVVHRFFLKKTVAYKYIHAEEAMMFEGWKVHGRIWKKENEGRNTVIK